MLLTDPVDEWVTMSVQDYDGMSLKSVSQGNFEDEEETEETKEDKNKATPLVDWLSNLLEEVINEILAESKIVVDGNRSTDGN